MTNGEIAFYSVIAFGNFILATEWAKYGLLELGIQRPMNPRALGALFLGMGAMVSAGIAHQVSGFDPKPNELAITLGVGAPVLWIFIFRAVFLPPGLFAFNKARARTQFWMMANFRPGEILQEQGKSLSEFPRAQNAIQLFRQAITAQSQGQKVRFIDRAIPINEEAMDYRGNVSMPCGQCGQTIKIPIRVYDGVSGVCMLCGCMVSARRQGDTMHLHTMLSKSHLLVTDRNRYNVGVAHEELALLYRMMNCFDEALLELQEALKIAEDLLENNPDHREYLALKSLAIFRQAEIYHCQGSRMKAKELYQISLAIDRTLNNEEGIQTITALYSKLE